MRDETRPGNALTRVEDVAALVEKAARVVKDLSGRGSASQGTMDRRMAAPLQEEVGTLRDALFEATYTRNRIATRLATNRQATQRLEADLLAASDRASASDTDLRTLLRQLNGIRADIASDQEQLEAQQEIVERLTEARETVEQSQSDLRRELARLESQWRAAEATQLTAEVYERLQAKADQIRTGLAREVEAHESRARTQYDAAQGTPNVTRARIQQGNRAADVEAELRALRERRERDQ